ncbi:amino acid ABC transporter permease [Afipia felis]|uniref:Inner membrane amino-acid ABC transporter permease protein yhdY n=2 Tax=Afipia felis TaxID=1035 RepID=A0A380W818_AFIFE|nr:amino acid ABC transporter permease [Afipia felis]EKS28324.1 His/Glu/Gln/Arg/opine family amino ABC transporter, permease, 3-TM region [Afipia felis ATCC 53690]SUU77033.1 Inner membrane amino-acid ABC transporter permease protein yhdY [Afipia felis]SUU85100.1 Inner membrane amino-acid ABC transporter permease protein yhdY [Afipia felis]
MSGDDTIFVRETLAPARKAPVVTTGIIGFLRTRLFNSPLNIVLTFASAALAWFVLEPTIRFLLVDAVWKGADRTACLADKVGHPVGACWPFIQAKFTQLIYGFYPEDQRWRANLTFALAALLLAPLLVPKIPGKTLNAGLFFIAFPFLAFFLLRGGGLDGFAFYWLAELIGVAWKPSLTRFWLDFSLTTTVVTAAAVGLWGGWPNGRRAGIVTALTFAGIALVIEALQLDRGGLPVVDTRQWGGLLVTLVVSITGIVASMPVGIALALGRTSRIPLLRIFSIAFIEFWRGVPLITVLFFATYMLPLFLPGDFTIDALVRVLVGIALFAGAYNAEVIRGGLLAIPRGQREAANALGLSYWKTTGLIVLPQALRHVIPSLVNSFIALFKDTTLVLIVAIFDLLGQLRAAFADPTWATPTTLFTGFAFTGIIYWVGCFAMSRYSLFVERRLNAHRRT